MKYHIDDTLSPGALLVYSLQWLTVMLPCVIILGAMAGRLSAPDIISQTIYVQKVFILMGAFSLIQILAGHKLPLVIGPSSALLVGLLAAQQAGHAANHTAIALGGTLLMVLAGSGVLRTLRRVFTPRLVAIILMLIAVTLAPVIVRLVFSSSGGALFSLTFAMGLAFILLLGNTLLPGVWKATTLVWGTLGGSLFYFYIQGLPAMPIPSQHEVWAAFQVLMPSFAFDTGILVAYAFCMVALLVNELGSIESVGHLLNADNMEQRTKKGVGITGLANMACGACGVVGPVDFSLSSGVITATGCASRYPLALAGALLAGMGCIPQLVAAVTHIPGVVMGGMFIYLMATQLATGFITAIKSNALATFNHALIVAMPMLTGMLIAFAPPEAIAQIPAQIRPILGNGFVMGLCVALILEHGLLREVPPPAP